jgi:hypothetical protein
MNKEERTRRIEGAAMMLAFAISLVGVVVLFTLEHLAPAR